MANEDPFFCKGLEMLYTAFGKELLEIYQDEKTLELMINPDGTIWIDQIKKGMFQIDLRLDSDSVMKIIYIAASLTGEVCNKNNPELATELPGDGSRVEALIPPLVEGPTLVIRKKALQVFTLDDYVNEGILSLKQKDIVVDAILKRYNILVAGSTGSGKTTFLNAILAEIAKHNFRVITIEDNIEIQNRSLNKVDIKVKKGLVSQDDALRYTLRLHPQRLFMGEVRDKAALALCKMWTSGHDGGGSSIHCGNAYQALSKMEQYIGEISVSLQKELIGDAVDLIIFIEPYGESRKITQILKVNGYDVKEQKYITELYE